MTNSRDECSALTQDQSLQQAVTHHKAGQLQDAERLYRAMLQAQPNHPDANHNLGVLWVQLKQPAAGLPHFKAALEANPNQGQYWLSYIDALIQTGQTDIARQVLEQGRQRGLQGEAVEALAGRLDHLKNATPDQPTELDCAIAHREAGRYKEAALVLQSWLVSNSQDASAYALLAQVLSLDKQDEPAWVAMNTALSINPALPVVQRNHARLLLKQQKLHEALQAAQAAYQSDATDPENQLVLAAALGANGRNEQAFPLVAKALQSRPNYAEAFATRALLKLRSGDPVGALADAEKSLSIKPHLGQLWGMVGSLRYQLKDLPGAIDALEKALDYEPDNVGHLVNLGEFKRQAGAVEAAIVMLEKAVAIAPENAGALVNLGTALQQAQRIPEAKAAYGKALKIAPEQAEVASNLGVLAREEENWEEALRYFNQALQIKPDSAEAHYNLGVTLKDLGRLDEALANYRLSLNAKGDWKEALRCLTTPLVLHTGMVLGSQSATSLAETCKQVTTLREHVAPPTAPTAPLAERQELHLRVVGHSEPGARKNLRIILIYPPPWQIPSPGDTLLGMPFGPPRDKNDCNLDGDFRVITYGLLTIAAQAKRAGHDVSVYNLSTCPWRDVVSFIAETEADVYGISAFTANRRGMGAVAALIRQRHPKAHITAGGPFVTALPLDTLRYFRDIDTAVIGEGEETFMELLECLGTGRPAVGIPGTAWRNGEEVAVGPTRPRIKDLDTLASPFDYFTSYIVMTSRGCPSKCTFCGSFTTWGKKLRFHSAESSLDTFKKALARLPVPFIAIKDDTFTAHRRRTIAICDAIIESKMNFMWSCDTRVDCLDDELLRKMRLAGCQVISLGVESGSPEILKTMRKETTPEMVLEATRSAQKYGMYVRHYMILCNRGETPETIQQSNDLIKAGRPNRYFFGALSFYPGTEDWEILCEQQGLTPEIFFRNDFKELSVAANRHKELQDVLLHVVCDIGAIYGFSYTVEEREAVVDRLPYLHSVHVELANAYFRAGRLDEAASALNRAEELGFPIGDIIYNQRACIALARSEVGNALTLLERAFQSYPHQSVMKNLNNLRAWADAPVNDRGKPPVLNDSVLALDFSSKQLHSARPTAI